MPVKSSRFRGDWIAAFREFVLDPYNTWCPPWIRRNYEVLNKIDPFLFKTTLKDASTQSDNLTTDSTDALTKRLRKIKFNFDLCGEPPHDNDDTGDAKDPAVEEPREDNRWDENNMTPGQIHSGWGPNILPQPTNVDKPVPLEEIVNPVDHNWNENWQDINLPSVRHFWDDLDNNHQTYSDESLNKDDLNDDYQLLFVNLVLRHVDDVLHAWEHGLQPKPMYLMLLGTAGTGKTRAVQTCLQELKSTLRRRGISG